MSHAKLTAALAWKAAADELQAAKAKESAARAEAIRLNFPDLADGLNKAELPRGYVLKATHYPNHKLDEAKLPDAIAAFRTQLGDVGVMLAQRLFKAKHEISVSEYKKLSPEGLALLKDVLTISPATPKLELVEPA